jgi:hypothetical protein
MDGKLQVYDLLEMLNYLELAHLNLDNDHHLMSSSHGLCVISLLMQTQGTIPNPHTQHKHIYVMG